MSVLWDLHVGATTPSGPSLRYQLRDRPALGQRFGAPMDLSTAVSVFVTGRRECDQVIVHEGDAVITSAATGNIAWFLDAPTVEQAGLVAFEIRVTWADTTVQTWPGTATSDFLYLRIRGNLAGCRVPAIPVGSTFAPLFIPDGGTGTVVHPNQIVYAGSGATVTVAPHVGEWRLAQNPQATPWTATTLPTLIQNGTTFSAGVGTAMETSGGDEITLGRDGTVWHSTTAGGGGGTADQEVGEGAVLPLNGSGVELFRLIGSTNPLLPDGPYWWNGTAWQPILPALSATFTQGTPATSWSFPHGLSFTPAQARFETLAGEDVIADTVTITATTVTATFVAPQAGRIFLS